MAWSGTSSTPRGGPNYSGLRWVENGAAALTISTKGCEAKQRVALPMSCPSQSSTHGPNPNPKPYGMVEEAEASGKSMAPRFQTTQRLQAMMTFMSL